MSKVMSSSASNSIFAAIPSPKVDRSLFKRNFNHKFTFNEGELIPLHVSDVYAGDTVQANINSFIRFTTPITPIMDGVTLDLHVFLVPARLVMSDYYKMLGEQVNPGDDVSKVIIPVIEFTGAISEVDEDSIYDHMGLPTRVSIPDDDMPIALPLRAYNLIWNDWFRDENLQDSLEVKTDNTDDDVGDYLIKRRNKKHDYFTSCLPWAQKGGDVFLPLDGEAPIVSDAINFNVINKLGEERQLKYDPSNVGNNKTQFFTPSSQAGVKSFADLSQATAITVNDLREAITVQHILERRARGGTRDIEILMNTYGVSPSDDRLQRPELLGVGRSDLNITTIAQTSETTQKSQLANLSAVGTINAGANFSYSAVENGFLMVLASARADISYQQGMQKMWSKRSYLQIMDPMRSHIGEQPVLRKEIYTGDDTAKNNEVFGYLPNYDDLRFGYTTVSGRFRSNATNSLDIWHLAEDFTTYPVLGSQFIQQQSPVDRVLALPSKTNPHFFGDMYMHFNHYRGIPIYGVPGLRRL